MQSLWRKSLNCSKNQACAINGSYQSFNSSFRHVEIEQRSFTYDINIESTGLSKVPFTWAKCDYTTTILSIGYPSRCGPHPMYPLLPSGDRQEAANLPSGLSDELLPFSWQCRYSWCDHCQSRGRQGVLCHCKWPSVKFLLVLLYMVIFMPCWYTCLYHSGSF